jgi:two-component system sensor histidine kinase PilS (NtrC family)
MAHSAGIAAARIGQPSEGWFDLLEPLRAASDDWVRLGIIGAALFIAAGLSLRAGGAGEARRGAGPTRTWELLEIAELNQGIIRHLQSGVVVVDRADQVQLLNDTARNCWLARGAAGGAAARNCRRRWRGSEEWRDGSHRTSAFRPIEHRPELIPRFTRLSGVKPRTW